MKKLILCCFASVFVALSTPVHAINYTYPGSLDTTDPSFTNPISAYDTYYDVQPFYLTLSGNVTLTVNSFNDASGDSDSTLFLYQGTFDPAAPRANLIVSDDDSNGNNLSRITRNLTAGTQYLVVTSSYYARNTGSYSDTIAPADASDVVTPGAVPEPSTWAMLGLGVVSAGAVALRRRAARAPQACVAS